MNMNMHVCISNDHSITARLLAGLGGLRGMPSSPQALPGAACARCIHLFERVVLVYSLGFTLLRRLHTGALELPALQPLQGWERPLWQPSVALVRYRGAGAEIQLICITHLIMTILLILFLIIIERSI